MPTRAGIDKELISRCGSFLGPVGISVALTGDPARVEAFDGAVTEGLAAVGVTVADPTAPAQSDIDNLPAGMKPWLKFLAVAELRVLENAASGAAGLATTRQGPDVTVTIDQKALTTVLTAKRESVRIQYGYGAGTIETGAVRLGFRKRRGQF